MLLEMQLPKHVHFDTLSFQRPLIPESHWEMTGALDFNLALTTADGTNKAEKHPHPPSVEDQEGFRFTSDSSSLAAIVGLSMGSVLAVVGNTL